ncbi:fibronectin type III domain-containing protein [Spirosoma linguale]|uniref:Fibronectin type III domain protein n=1 Tax=Spirosoma linguale (strain ATCC 33905 / DSM 74 / LMG 10896 / Claus 1) TaxID=504472 RepID=D2QKV7_SPILD|nr:Fibronectin type III domain protein [Spirosoma linguale DSM 74]
MNRFYQALSLFVTGTLRCRWSILLVLSLMSQRNVAQSIQNYPVHTSAYFVGPPSQRLADYFSADKRLLVDLLLKDLTKPAIQVYLRWSLEGVGIRVGSQPGYVPPHFITLQPGILNRQRGSDLQADYFNPAAIQTQGIDPRSAYTIQLPEGFYTLNLEALEASTGQIVSNTSQTFLVLTYPQPPLLNLPLTGSELSPTALQKVPISWSPRHFATPTTNAVYTLKVCEVPEGFEPNEQVMLTCTEPRLEMTIPATTTAPDITQWIKPLEVGHRYAFQVSVTDLSGEMTNFVNQGRSQVSYFRYGKECRPPAFTIQSLGSDRVQLSWERTEGAQGYVVEYKLATAPDWQTLSATGTAQVIGGLKPTADYLFRMRSDCGGSAPSAPGEIQTWNIRDEAPDTPLQLPLTLTNPIAIRVQTGPDGQAQLPTSLSALYRNYPSPSAPSPGTTSPPAGSNPTPGSQPTTTGAVSTTDTGGTGQATSSPTPADAALLTLPYCAMQASSFAGCEVPHPSVALPTGEKELTSLQVGDVLGIYDYAVFVTRVGGGSPLSGEGLARLPFLGGTMVLVEFSGVSARAGEDGTNGGCVYQLAPSGFFRIKRTTQAQVLAAQQGLIRQVLVQHSGNPADSTRGNPFVGTLGEALAKYDSVVVSLGTPQRQTLSAATRQSLIQYLAAVAQGSESIRNSFDAVYGGSQERLVVSIRDSLAQLMGQVRASLTAVQSGSSGADLEQLAARYEALFAQLGQLTSPSHPTPVSPSLSPVVLSQLTDTSVKLSWQGDPSFSRYVVHYQLEGGGELLQTVTGTNIQLVNLKAGSNYNYTIEGYKGTELVSRYGGTPFTTLTKTIPAPQNLTYAVVDDHRVKLSWDKNSQHVSYKLVYTDATGEQRTVYPTTNQVKLTGLATNQAYTYAVMAYGSGSLVSDGATSNFQLGTVCYATMQASAERVIAGTEVTLTVSSCRDKEGNPGMVIWTGKGLPQTFGTTQVFRPSETATYTSSCRLMVDNGNGPEPVSCSDSKTITVDKACTGVIATVSPKTVDQYQPIVLQATGCASNIRWGVGYPTDAGVVSTQQAAIIYPTTSQNKAQIYTLACKDQTGTTCLVQAGTVYTQCAFKLGVTTQSSGGVWGINAKANKQIIVEATGCSGEIVWQREGGNSNIEINQVNGPVPANTIVYSNIRTGFTVNATCRTTGCQATTGPLDVPSTSTLCDMDHRLFIQNLGASTGDLRLAVSTINGKLPGLTDLPLKWDDNGSTTNPRTIPRPNVPSVFSVTTEIGGCKAAYAYQPTPPSPNTLPPIPCIEFTISAPPTTDIPWNKSAVEVTLGASGCANPDPGIVSWTDQAGNPILPDKTGNITVVFSQTGTSSFSATCSLTGETKVATITIRKGTKPPVTFKVTPSASGIIPAGGGPVDLLLQSSGCTDADPALPDGTVTWRNPNKSPIAAVPGKIGSTRVSFTQPGTYTYTATCSLNNVTLPVTVTVTQQVIPIPTDPCNFYAYTNSQDNFFPTNSYNNIELTVVGGTSIAIYPENGAPPITNIGGGKYVASTSAITQPIIFSYRITNTGQGGECTTRVVINLYDQVTTYHSFVASSVTPPTPAYPEKPSGNCGSYYAGSGAATFGIPWNGNQYQVDKVKRSNHPNLGVFASYLRKADDENRSVTNLPDLVGLVDKQCDARKGRLRFYADYSRSIELPIGAALTPMLHVMVPRPDRTTTYYGRCFYDEGYCDSEITLSTNLNGGGRVGTSEDSSTTDGGRQAATQRCVYSTQAAVKTLLAHVLCDKLSAVPGGEEAKLAAIKATLQQQGIQLADITDAMVANLKAGDCANVVTALTNVPKGADDVQPVADLDKLINNDLVNTLVNDALSAVAEDDVIDTDFVEREIETFTPTGGLRVANPNARLADPGTCPVYYFSPAGKRIVVPDVRACVVSVNGVLLQFVRDGKTYIPLYSRTTNAFLGYYEQTAFLAKAKPNTVNGKTVDIAPKTALTDWVIDIQYPDEQTGLARYREFININKTRPGIILNYSEEAYGQILAILAQLPDLHFQTVEGNGSPFLYDMAKHLKQLTTYLQQSNDRLATLVGIVNDSAYVCPVANPPAANADPVCKLYSCVYNSSLKNSDRDLLNARLDLDTRQKLLSLLAQGSLTSGWVPVGCAVSADGEGAILSLLRSTQENDRKAILDHINGSLVTNSYSPLQAFISKLDGSNFDALMSLLTSWVTTYYPSSESWASILQRQDRAKRNILVLGNFSDRYSLSAQYSANKTLLNVEVSVRLSTTKLFKRKIDVLDYVVVKFANDYAAGSQTFESGKIYKLPAVLVYELMNAMQRQTRLDLAKYGAYGVFAALTAGEIVAAETGIELTLALLDMGVFGTDIVINEVLATKLNQTPDGKAFLDKYNKFALIYGGVRVYADLTGLTAQMKSLANKLDDPEIKTLQQSVELSQLDKDLAELKTAILSDDPTSVQKWFDLFQETFLYKGAASSTHSIRYEQIIADLKVNNVKVKYTTDIKSWYGNYQPTKGEAGQLTINPDVDLSTLEHEYKHFLDDKANNYPGPFYYLYDDAGIPVRIKMERASYDIEKSIIQQRVDLTEAEKVKFSTMYENLYEYEIFKITRKTPDIR